MAEEEADVLEAVQTVVQSNPPRADGDLLAKLYSALCAGACVPAVEAALFHLFPEALLQGGGVRLLASIRHDLPPAAHLRFLRKLTQAGAGSGLLASSEAWFPALLRTRWFAKGSNVAALLSGPLLTLAALKHLASGCEARWHPTLWGAMLADGQTQPPLCGSRDWGLVTAAYAASAAVPPGKFPRGELDAQQIRHVAGWLFGVRTNQPHHPDPDRALLESLITAGPLSVPAILTPEILEAFPARHAAKAAADPDAYGLFAEWTAGAPGRRLPPWPVLDLLLDAGWASVFACSPPSYVSLLASVMGPATWSTVFQELYTRCANPPEAYEALVSRVNLRRRGRVQPCSAIAKVIDRHGPSPCERLRLARITGTPVWKHLVDDVTCSFVMARAPGFPKLLLELCHPAHAVHLVEGHRDPTSPWARFWVTVKEALSWAAGGPVAPFQLHPAGFPTSPSIGSQPLSVAAWNLFREVGLLPPVLVELQLASSAKFPTAWTRSVLSRLDREGVVQVPDAACGLVVRACRAAGGVLGRPYAAALRAAGRLGLADLFWADTAPLSDVDLWLQWDREAPPPSPAVLRAQCDTVGKLVRAGHLPPAYVSRWLLSPAVYDAGGGAPWRLAATKLAPLAKWCATSLPDWHRLLVLVCVEQGLDVDAHTLLLPEAVEPLIQLLASVLESSRPDQVLGLIVLADLEEGEVLEEEDEVGEDPAATAQFARLLALLVEGRRPAAAAAMAAWSSVLPEPQQAALAAGRWPAEVLVARMTHALGARGLQWCWAAGLLPRPPHLDCCICLDRMEDGLDACVSLPCANWHAPVHVGCFQAAAAVTGRARCPVCRADGGGGGGPLLSLRRCVDLYPALATTGAACPFPDVVPQAAQAMVRAHLTPR